MKPGKNDRKHAVLIAGAELDELKKFDFPESYGLGDRIFRYKGTRPLTLYRWDLECLIDTLDAELEGWSRPKRQRPPENPILRALRDRLRQEYEAAYGPSDPPSPPAMPARPKA